MENLPPKLEAIPLDRTVIMRPVTQASIYIALNLGKNENLADNYRGYCGDHTGRDTVRFRAGRSIIEEGTRYNEIRFRGNTAIVKVVLSTRREYRYGRTIYITERTNFEISIENIEKMLFNDYRICTNNVERYFRNNPRDLREFYIWVSEQHRWVSEQHRNAFGNRYRRGFQYNFQPENNENQFSSENTVIKTDPKYFQTLIPKTE